MSELPEPPKLVLAKISHSRQPEWWVMRDDGEFVNTTGMATYADARSLRVTEHPSNSPEAVALIRGPINAVIEPRQTGLARDAADG